MFTPASQTIDSEIPAIQSPEMQGRVAVAAEQGRSNAEIDEVALALRRTALVCSVLLVAIALLVLLGWVLENEALTSVLRGHVRMKANTAIGFLAAGLAMTAHLAAERLSGTWNPATMRRWAWGLALVTFGLGGLSLMEYLFRIDLHIDQLLFVDQVQRVDPGRMAIITAANFCLGGLSLLVFGSGRRRRRVSRAIALALAVDAFAAIVGYLYGVEIFYGAVGLNAMALHTGASFVLLGVGTVFLDSKSRLVRELCTKASGGVLLRRSLPVAVLLPVVLGRLYLLPAVNFGHLRFGMALFAVTLACVGTMAVWSAAVAMGRSERQRNEILRVREQSAAAVRKSERELRLVTDHLPTLLSYIDTAGRYVRVNRTYERWMGRPAEEIVGRSIRELLGKGFWEQSADARVRVLRGETVTFETTYPTVNGDRHAEITYAPDTEESGEVRGIACMVLDIHQRWEAEMAARQSAELEKANQSLQQLADTDPLTGLKNRRAFEERIQAAFISAREDGKELSVLMIDIDNFKKRNDTWGHAAGDDVLRRLGALLIANVREPDMAARYGGEEFTVLLPGSSGSCAWGVAERLRGIVKEQDWSEAAVTLSIGVSSRTKGMIREDELLRAADQAMYRAKRTGKDKICSAV
jgi:diguanylate cyclase (GGDEF)-like protein/PAS domain S-box-containing protein